MTGANAPVVVFEETGERREVKGGCFVCKVTPEDVRAFSVIVSPTGIAHHSRDGYGDTVCGKDATRNGWWWPL